MKFLARGLELENDLLKVVTGHPTAAIVGSVSSLFCEVVSSLAPKDKQFFLRALNVAIVDELKYQDEQEKI